MINLTGVLYICATPIGNLEDITLRVLRTLKEVDLIAAEDTRYSQRLLRHYNIQTPMISYHQHNRKSKGPGLIIKLKKGMNIALITDAGTPGISDPGEDLVKLAYKEDIKVYSLPGATACITALTLSGLSTRRFTFEAFLPKDNKLKKRILEELQNESRTIIIYEAPHRLLKTLDILFEYIGDRKITIVRELTKQYEEINQTTLKNAVIKYKEEEVKGEIVLIIEGKSWEEIDLKNKEQWLSVSLVDHMEYYKNQGIQRNEAMKKVAKDRGLPKREIYSELLKYKDNEQL